MVYHPREHQLDPLHEPVAVIGSGLAGLITAHTLLQDGFANVEILTRDKSVGGVWSEERKIRFETGGPHYSQGRMMGEGGPFLYTTKTAPSAEKGPGLILPSHVLWHRDTESHLDVIFRGIVIHLPESLALEAAKAARFSGPVLHSMDFASRIDDLLSCTAPTGSDAPRQVVVVGSGNAAAFLANEGRPVTVIFRTADAFLASPKPLPDAIRKSRFLSVMAGDKELRSRLE
ncbi:hypothetical protein EDB86DRAFT_2837858 [Lactarius hatsudake]|nr:hypothetical protein EDB86DRAFT_2837858 [Lactarius hatsudake]